LIAPRNEGSYKDVGDARILARRIEYQLLLLLDALLLGLLLGQQSRTRFELLAVGSNFRQRSRIGETIHQFANVGLVGWQLQMDQPASERDEYNTTRA
jgi:hypothetical protein